MLRRCDHTTIQVGVYACPCLYIHHLCVFPPLSPLPVSFREEKKGLEKSENTKKENSLFVTVWGIWVDLNLQCICTKQILNGHLSNRIASWCVCVSVYVDLHLAISTRKSGNQMLLSKSMLNLKVNPNQQQK